MDIGYRDGVSPGRYRYSLLLVDSATSMGFVYGLLDITADSLITALWRFAIDAGGFPRQFQCDFDPRFLSKRFSTFCASHGIRLTAAPAPWR